MNSISAISARVIQLFNIRNWTAYILAFERGLPNSTVSNILLCKSCNFDTILNFCRRFVSCSKSSAILKILTITIH